MTLYPLNEVDIARFTRATGLTWRALIGANRTPAHVNARYVFMKALKEERGMSVCQIGRLLKRDPSTVSHGIARAPQLLSHPVYQRMHAELCEAILLHLEDAVLRKAA